MGYYSKTICEKLYTKTSAWLIITGILGIVMLFLTLLLDDDLNSSKVLSLNSLYFGNYPLMFLSGAVGGMLLVFSLAQILSRYKLLFVQELSNGMIVTLGLQQLLFMIISKLFRPSYNVLIALAVSLSVYVICYAFIKICERYSPVLLGNRKLK